MFGGRKSQKEALPEEPVMEQPELNGWGGEQQLVQADVEMVEDVGDLLSSTLGSHLSFEGQLRFNGSVTVDCHFKGNVETDGKFGVGPSGVVEADIVAADVEIAGQVHGNIVAVNSVRVCAGGQVFGNIETPSISMEEGVVFEGSCTRPRDKYAPVGAAAGAARPADVEPEPETNPHSDFDETPSYDLHALEEPSDEEAAKVNNEV